LSGGKPGDLDFSIGLKDGFGVAGLEDVQAFEGVSFAVFPVYNVSTPASSLLPSTTL
jgi:hypothetical protein